jgi:hypothetical protein
MRMRCVNSPDQRTAQQTGPGNPGMEVWDRLTAAGIAARWIDCRALTRIGKLAAYAEGAAASIEVAPAAWIGEAWIGEAPAVWVGEPTA